MLTVSLQHLSPMQNFLNGLNFLHMGKLFWQLPLIASVVLVIRWHFFSQSAASLQPGSPLHGLDCKTGVSAWASIFTEHEPSLQIS